MSDLPVRPVNFRDVGDALGLWCDNSPIPTGRLLRGGKIDALTTPRDLNFPRTILNLRLTPDPAHLDGVVHVHLPADDVRENYDTRRWKVRSWVEAALGVLAHPETAWPVYVHCAAGRDRTGVVVAAALLSIGVDEAVIVDEYALSDGADVAALRRALAGLRPWLPTARVDRERLRAALTGER